MTLGLAFAALLAVCLLVTVRTRDLFNPVNIAGAGFFLNLLLAELKLSPLQDRTWAPETRSILLQAWVCWFIYPAVILLLFAGRRPGDARLARDHRPLRHPYLGRALAVGVIVAYMLENLWLADTPLPLLQPVTDIHARTTSGLGIITGSLGIAMCLVLLISYLRVRRRLDLVLLAVVLLLPVTRLARFDLVTTLVSLLVLAYYLSGRPSRRYIVALPLAAVVLLPALLGISYYRSSQGGLYEVDYADDLGLVADDPLTSAAAYYYRYLVLSFDSFDGLVRNNLGPENRTDGLFTVRPVTLGILRLHNLFDGYPQSAYLAERSQPALGGKVIATGLSYFFLDFGDSLIWIPLSLYMSLILAVYLRRGGSSMWTVVYALLAAALSLSSFTDLLSNVKIYYAMLACTAVLSVNLSLPRSAPRCEGAATG